MDKAPQQSLAQSYTFHESHHRPYTFTSRLRSKKVSTKFLYRVTEVLLHDLICNPSSSELQHNLFPIDLESRMGSDVGNCK